MQRGFRTANEALREYEIVESLFVDDAKRYDGTVARSIVTWIARLRSLRGTSKVLDRWIEHIRARYKADRHGPGALELNELDRLSSEIHHAPSDPVEQALCASPSLAPMYRLIRSARGGWVKYEALKREIEKPLLNDSTIDRYLNRISTTLLACGQPELDRPRGQKLVRLL